MENIGIHSISNEPMNDILALVTQYKELGLHTIIDYDKFNRYAVTYHSTALEGATLTEEETAVLLDEGITPKGKPLEHSLMVKDHYDALLFVLHAAENRTPVTAGFIRQISARVMKTTGSIINTPLGTVDASKGELRKSNVRAGRHYFITYDKVPDALALFVRQIAGDLQKAATPDKQLLLAFSAHFDLVSIHPFYDGNGRVSRLLMNYIQALFSLPLSIVFQDDKAAYITALNESGKAENKQPFYDFMLQEYTRFLTGEIQKYHSLQQTPPVKKGSSFGLFF
ncbi:MAG: Fic family protein [Prevotellaceae bacterium]|jgi:Fic family protein|nr:Fic family protein [Prevotellaceae bacterium]